MRLWQKILLVIEVVACFGPATFFAGLGLLVVLDSSIIAPERTLLGVMVAAAIVGVVTLVYVMNALLRSREVLGYRGLALLGIAIGVAPLLYMTTQFGDGAGLAIYALILAPLACAVHVVYVARHLLFAPASTPHD